MDSNKKRSFIIFGIVIVIGLILTNNQAQKATVPTVKNEIIDTIIIDRAKHNAALKEKTNPKYNLSLAKQYQVINKRDTGFANYHRGQIHIYADTNNEDERIATLVKSAKDFKASDNYQYFQVFMNAYPTEMTSIGSMGSLTYDVQGKGVSGRDNNQPSMTISVAIGNITPEQDKAIKAWNKHRTKFLEDGLLNEEKLKSYLLKQKILTEQEIDLLPVFFDTKNLTIYE